MDTDEGGGGVKRGKERETQLITDNHNEDFLLKFLQC